MTTQQTSYHLVCETTDSTGYANYGEVFLDPKRAEQLFAYRGLVPPLKAHDTTFYCVEFFEDITWGDSVNTDAFDDCDGEWKVAAEGVELEGEVWPAAGTLKVTTSGVLWSASPKHSDGYWETQELSWAVLQEIAAGKAPSLDTAYPPTDVSEETLSEDNEVTDEMGPLFEDEE